MKNEDNINKSRLADFHAILRWHICNKIIYHQSIGNITTPHDIYTACDNWGKFKNREIDYNPTIYRHLHAVNDMGITRYQTRRIFGKVNGKYIKYESLIEGTDITSRDKGTQSVKGETHWFNKCYFLPEKEIAGIFADKALLDNIIDVKSDLYTERQKKIIFQFFLGCKPLPKREKTKTPKKTKQTKQPTQKEIRKMRIPEEDITEEKPTTETPTQKNKISFTITPKKLQGTIDNYYISKKEAELISTLYGYQNVRYKEAREGWGTLDPYRFPKERYLIFNSICEECKKTSLTIILERLIKMRDTARRIYKEKLEEEKTKSR